MVGQCSNGLRHHKPGLFFGQSEGLSCARLASGFVLLRTLGSSQEPIVMIAETLGPQGEIGAT
jgi:hypothetical protein